MISERELQKTENGATRRIFAFAEFSFDAEDKILWRGGEPVSLPPKTCELLAAFVENAGQMLSKEDLLNLVWKDTFVEEANLSHHIAVLRKSLGETKNGKKFIQTIPRKGYRFVAPVGLASPPRETLEITVSEHTTTHLFEEIEVEKDNFSAQADESKSVSSNKSLKPAEPIRHRAAGFFAIALLSLVGITIFVWLKFSPTAGGEQIQNPKFQIQNPMTSARITNSGKVGAASISPDGKFVAYIQNSSDGAGTVYIRQTDTNIERRLAVHEKGEFGTTEFSPDSAFVFYILRRDATHSETGIYRVPVIGGTPVRVAEKLEGSFFALSPDGLQAAFIRTDGEQKQMSLVAVSLDGSGGEQILLTRPLREMQLVSGGAFSPDGRFFVLPVKTAAATGNYSQKVVNLMRLNLQTGELGNLTEETWAETGIMKWMPDASGVILIAAQPRLQNQIYFISASSGEVSRVTNDANGYGNYGLGITADGKTMVTDIWEFPGRVWTLAAAGDMKTAAPFSVNYALWGVGLTALPDGQIVFSMSVGAGFDLWTLSEADAEAKPLTSDIFYDAQPVASPDGTFIVFVSDRADLGTKHLFRVNADGSRIEQLTFGEGSERSPEISPDGNWIIYESKVFDAARGEETFTIRRIPVAGGASVQLTENCFSPAFAPDGARFSCTVQKDNYHGKIKIFSSADGAKLKEFEVDYFFHQATPVRWTPDGTAVVFRVAENQANNLWKQNISGGAPTRLTDFKSESIFDFIFSRDGKRLLVSRGNVAVNVVMFKNFR